ncbi:MAG: TonB-dependent receptor [Bacteroidetes bacterium]|nr:TonB-dependent receptor [Bacteroidota bacterium]
MIILRSQTLSKVILQFRMFRWVSITAVLTTIVITPWFTYDPINLPKVVVVTTGGFLFLGVLLSNTKAIIQILGIPLFLFLVFFFIALVINLLFAPSPFTQKLWGVFGRDNGALSYLALALVLAASASIMNVNHYKKIFFLLPLTAIPISSYSLFQLAGLDPVDWSYKAAFATLGNVNFLSAFLGMACVAFLSTYFVRDIKRKIRILALLMIPIMLFIIYSTDSIQGFAVFLSGAVVIGFLEVRKRSRYFLYLFSLTTVLSFVLSVMALLNIGPLAKLIYQPSITFRFDYMHAALKTFVNNPIVGVGLDGFGDWYRNYRGIISAFRTGTSRTTNSAHNIFLDVASGGGILLLIPTLAIFIYAALVSIKALRKVENQDPVFVGFIAVWVGYLVQSLISINQIGVGIWGWIFTGVICGYARCLGVAERPGFNSPFKVNNFSRFEWQNAFNYFNRSKNTIKRNLVTGAETPYRPEDQDTSIFTMFNSRGVYTQRNPANPVSWTMGYDFMRETALGKRIPAQLPGITDVAIFGAMEYAPSKEWQVRPSLRILHNSRFGNPIISSVFGNRVKMAPLIPSLQLKYNLSKHLSFRGSYAKGFRAPSLKELNFYFVDMSHNVHGNDSLKAEISDNFILSFDYRHPFSSTSGAIFSFSLFNNIIRNKINLALIDLNTNYYTYINIGRFRSQGLSTNFNLTRKFPDQKASVSLLSRYTSPTMGYMENNERYRTAGFYLLDLTAQKAFPGMGLHISCGVKNILGVTTLASTRRNLTPHSEQGLNVNITPGRTLFLRFSYDIK